MDIVEKIEGVLTEEVSLGDMTDAYQDAKEKGDKKRAKRIEKMIKTRLKELGLW